MTSPSFPPYEMRNRNSNSNNTNDDYQNEQHPTILQSIKQSLHKIAPHQLNHPPNNINESLAKFAAGTLAFYTTSFLSQCIQYQLKISTGTRPIVIPMMVGGMTVAAGSWMSHCGGVGMMAGWNRWSGGSSLSLDGMVDAGRVGMLVAAECVRPMKLMFERGDRLTRVEKKERREVWVHAAGVCILGLLTYKTILRSHFTSLSPSSYTAKGSFARIGLPAPPNFNYATSSQRTQLERIGRAWGCHTCGSRMLFSNAAKKDWYKPRFHGDHIPPVSVAKQLNERWYRKRLGWKVSQKFYPQCRDCSNKQGGLLSKAINAGHKNLHSVGGGGESFFHGRRLRIGHLTGGIVAVVTVGNGVEGGVIHASRERVRLLREWVVDVGRDVRDRCKSWWRS